MMRTHLGLYESAQSIGVDTSLVRDWISQGILPAERSADGSWRIPVSELLEFVRRKHLTLTAEGRRLLPKTQLYNHLMAMRNLATEVHSQRLRFTEMWSGRWHLEDLLRTLESEGEVFEEKTRRWQEADDIWQKEIAQKEKEIAALKNQLKQLQEKLLDEVGQKEALQKQWTRAQNEWQNTTQVWEVEKRQTEEKQKALCEEYELNLKEIQAQKAELEQKVCTVQDHCTRTLDHLKQALDDKHALKQALDAERASWQELWDRGRASWEMRRRELTDWEDRFRQERESWLSQLKAEERKTFEVYVESLRQMPQTGQEPLRIIRPEIYPFGMAQTGAALQRFSPVAIAMMGATACLLFLCVTFLRVRIWHTSSSTLSGIATDGKDIWLSDWVRGEIVRVSVDTPDVPEETISFSQDIHPSALAFDGGKLLWTLDPLSRRLRRHNPERKSLIDQDVSVPADVPQGLAWDGNFFWVLDTETLGLIRFSPAESSRLLAQHQFAFAQAAAFTVRLTRKENRELWVFDDHKHQLYQFALGEGLQRGGLSRRSVYKVPEAVRNPSNMVWHGGALWFVSEKDRIVGRIPVWRLLVHKIWKQ